MTLLSGLRDLVRRLVGRRPRADVPPGQLGSVAELLAALEEIGAQSTDGDGLAAFNGMYLRVTRRVHQRITERGFRDPAYMARLTTVFGGLYVDAVRAPVGSNKAWAPLLESRHDGGRVAIQYALAGMNAHINYDLPVAVVTTNRQLGVGLDAVAADYRAITDLLAEEQDAVRRSFLRGIALEVDRHLVGPVASLVGSWSIARARDAAWTNARVLWEIEHLEPVSGEFLGTLQRTVGMAGRLLLTPLSELEGAPALPGR